MASEPRERSSNCRSRQRKNRERRLERESVSGSPRGEAPRVSVDGRFRQRVLFAVRRIPTGRVATYGDVARAAGAPRAARAVGNIMKGCRVAGVPCHRVVAAGGRLGGYGGSEALKRALLV